MANTPNRLDQLESKIDRIIEVLGLESEFDDGYRDHQWHDYPEGDGNSAQTDLFDHSDPDSH